MEDKELKAKWVSELRDGGHKQARGKLLDKEGGLCCLGVLHRVIKGKNPAEAMWGGTNPCPGEILESLPVETQNALAEMNDDGQSFAEIADYIEANL